MNTDEARNLAIDLMQQHGLIHMWWNFKWYNRRKTFGSCKHSQRLICLSLPLTEINSIDDVRDTILHEIAHALVAPGHGHDNVWKRKAREIGARPERCFGDQVAQPKGEWQAICPGCQTIYHRYRKPKNPCHCIACRKKYERTGRSVETLRLVWCREDLQALAAKPITEPITEPVNLAPPSET